MKKNYWIFVAIISLFLLAAIILDLRARSKNHELALAGQSWNHAYALTIPTDRMDPAYFLNDPKARHESGEKKVEENGRFSIRVALSRNTCVEVLGNDLGAILVAYKVEVDSDLITVKILPKPQYQISNLGYRLNRSCELQP